MNIQLVQNNVSTMVGERDIHLDDDNEIIESQPSDSHELLQESVDDYAEAPNDGEVEKHDENYENDDDEDSVITDNGSLNSDGIDILTDNWDKDCEIDNDDASLSLDQASIFSLTKNMSEINPQNQKVHNSNEMHDSPTAIS